MARNKKEANRRVFERLEELLPDGISGLKVGPDVPRWIKTKPGPEEEYLKHCKVVQSWQCLRGKTVLELQCGEQRFIVLPEKPWESEPFMPGLTRQVNDNPGILTVVWGEGNWPIRRYADIGFELANEVFGVDGGFEYCTIAKFFEPLDVWEIDPSELGPGPTRLYQVYGRRLIQEPELLTLEFSSDLLDKAGILLERYPGNVLGEPVFRALTATHYEHAFLEFYRCIERLYPVPYIRGFYNRLPNPPSFNELAMFVEKELRWRPRDEDALIKLLGNLDDKAILTRLEQVLHVHIQSPTSEVRSAPVARRIYELRNSIAHFRATSRATYSTLDWNLVLSILCDAIIELYSKYETIVSREISSELDLVVKVAPESASDTHADVTLTERTQLAASE